MFHYFHSPDVNDNFQVRTAAALDEGLRDVLIPETQEVIMMMMMIMKVMMMMIMMMIVMRDLLIL